VNKDRDDHWFALKDHRARSTMPIEHGSSSLVSTPLTRKCHFRYGFVIIQVRWTEREGDSLLLDPWWKEMNEDVDNFWHRRSKDCAVVKKSSAMSISEQVIREEIKRWMWMNGKIRRVKGEVSDRSWDEQWCS